MKKLLLKLLCVTLLAGLFGAPAVQAEAADEGRTVRGTFKTFGHKWTQEYRYDDAYFSLPSDMYHHDFARLSLGLSLCAFRNKDNPDRQDDNLLAFLEEMGFSEAETDAYRTGPTKDSICYGLARKTVGDTTVILCAVCGGNYGAEWASNLTVGDEDRSVGFRDASMQVQAALTDYLDRHSAEGKVKLWITGFSRAAAVANITAADCTASGRFDDVYAYLFATPQTVKNPVAYPNIFNIVQKEDVVPRIPLEDWGYHRYGQDLFLVSTETDADCAPVMEKAADLYREMTGAEMVFNTEINYQIRTLIDYLLMLMPNAKDYAEHLQPVIIGLMTGDEEAEDALFILMKALDTYAMEDPDAGEELKEMRDYLGTLLNVYLLQGKPDRLPPDQWDPEQGIMNLFNAHNPYEYLAMMEASDDPAVLFSDNTEYIRLIIYGSADIAVSDGDKVLKQILADGKELVDGAENPRAFPEAHAEDDKVMITLPADRSYTVAVTSRSALPQTVTYTGLRASGHSFQVKTDNVYSYFMGSGETAVIRTSAQGGVIEPEGSDHTDISFLSDTVYSPTTAMRLENNRVVHLTISGLINRLLLLVLILLIMAITAIVMAIIRKKKHRPKNPVAAFIWHGLAVVLFALPEVAFWYFIPVLPLAKIIPGILVFIVLLIYCFKGCRSVSRRWGFFWALVLLQAAHALLEGLNGDFTVLKGILLVLVHIGFLIAAFVFLWHRRKAEAAASQP